MVLETKLWVCFKQTLPRIIVNQHVSKKCKVAKGDQGNWKIQKESEEKIINKIMKALDLKQKWDSQRQNN